MAAVLLDGKVIAKRLKEAIKQEVAVLKSKRGRAPKLVAVEVGQNASSAVYVKAQKKAADSVGIEYELKVVPQETSQDEAENLIDGLNNDKSVSAIILQMPVPRGMDAKKLVNLISPEKDAEGMHPQNLGKILLGRYKIGPCTAMAVMELLESTKVNLYGKEAVIVCH